MVRLTYNSFLTSNIKNRETMFSIRLNLLTLQYGSLLDKYS